MMKEVSSSRCFDGEQKVFEHDSPTLGCTMRFGVYLPPAVKEGPCHVLWWLSGLTCTEQNFITKAGPQRFAAQHGLVIVNPDTSPRGCGMPGEDDSYDFGSGAGFYVDATQQPWSKHYRMDSYVTQELPQLVREHFPVSEHWGIFGHSMGGHGALVLGMRNPDLYQSVSAFSPIVAPSQVPWGRKAFGAYLGSDETTWAEYDACALVASRKPKIPLLVDQGDADEFLEEQLQPQRLEDACRDADVDLALRRRTGYDHSFYFVSTFMEEHIAHHAQSLSRL